MTDPAKEKCQIGVIGLGVMGTSIARNLASCGLSVVIFNPPIPGEEGKTHQVFDLFPEANFTPAESYEDVVAKLSTPTTIFIMVKAGNAVDSVISALLPFLGPKSTIIDGGNSHFDDTARRVEELQQRGYQFVGMGVSGGEEGALLGPAMMPGGNEAARSIVQSLFKDAAAKANDGEPCIHWVGKGGAGHFVKMVHNGIEYAEMQLIAEVYDMLKKQYGLNNESIAGVFDTINTGVLESYLLSITVSILRHKENSEDYTLGNILPVGGQKGTGRWTIDAAMRYGAAIPSITAAVEARTISALAFQSPSTDHQHINDSLNEQSIDEISAAFHLTKLLIFDQGLNLIQQASDAQDWQVDVPKVISIWRAGCIIRSNMLDEMSTSMEGQNTSNRLIYSTIYQKLIEDNNQSLINIVSDGIQHHIPVPVLSASLNYLHTLSSDKLPMNLIQAQRDFFGAHTYEKQDQPRGVFFHTDWQAED